MEEDKKEKSKLVVILVTILGILGLGAIGGVLTKGVKTVKVVNTVNTANKFRKTAEGSRIATKNEDRATASEVIGRGGDGLSAADTANTIIETNELQRDIEQKKINK